MADADFQNFIDEIIDKNDIVDVISEYARPKRVGTRFAALCPLHNDKKSPSLSISPEKQVFHCFGCNAGGNVINFIMAAENLDFMDAVRYLADRAKIPVPEFKRNGDNTKDNADKKQLIYKINSEAARYFYSNLAGENGGNALSYLRNRGIKNSTIKMFGIGYAPEGWTNLIDYLKEKGYKEQEIFEAGLAKRRDNGSYYDSFYDGRVMFPIINVQGNIIGFGGRIITEKSNTGKYLNSPETIVFKKKENLFGLNLAKNDKSGTLLLMEGYMDVISLHQEGIGNAVASLGTAFTEEQAKLVKRYGGKAVLCYDSDEAGKKATLRAGEILSKSGIKTRILTINDGKDPDEYVRKKGGDMFRVLIDGAKPLIEYKIDEIQKQYSLDNSEHILEFTEAAAKVLAEITNPIEYEIYSKKVSDKSGISISSLNSVVAEIKRNMARIDDIQEERRLRKLRLQNERQAAVDPRLYNAEKLMLNLLCDSSVYKLATEQGLTSDNFTVELHKKVADIIFTLYKDQGSININEILSSFNDEERGMVTRILVDDKNTHDKKKAALYPLDIILSEAKKHSQKELLENRDLKSLDDLLKQTAKRKQQKS